MADSNGSGTAMSRHLLGQLRGVARRGASKPCVNVRAGGGCSIVRQIERAHSQSMMPRRCHIQLRAQLHTTGPCNLLPFAESFEPIVAHTRASLVTVIACGGEGDVVLLITDKVAATVMSFEIKTIYCYHSKKRHVHGTTWHYLTYTEYYDTQ